MISSFIKFVYMIQGIEISPASRHYDFSTSTPSTGVLATYKSDQGANASKAAKNTVKSSSQRSQANPKSCNVVSPRRNSANGFSSASPIHSQAR